MMIAVNLFYAVFLPTLAGAGVVRFLCRDAALPWSGVLALGYVLGCGILGQWMLVLGACGGTYAPATIGGPLAVLGGFCWLAQARGRNPVGVGGLWVPDSRARLSWLNGVMMAFIIIQGMLCFWAALMVPVLHWDGLSFIAYDAKVFFYQRQWYLPSQLPHPAYPLQVPFLMTWTALCLGGWDEQAVKIIFPCCFLAYLVIHYTFLRCYVRRSWALFGLVVLLSSAFLTYHGTLEYRDFFMMTFHCSAVFLLLMWGGQTRVMGLLLLAGIFSGLTSFVKLEGAVYVVMHTFLLGLMLWQNRRQGGGEAGRHLLAFMVPSWGMLLFYLGCKFFGGLPLSEHASCDIGVSYAGRLWTLLRAFGFELFLSGNWGIVWGVLGLSLIKGGRMLRRQEMMVLLSSLLLLIGFYFFFAFLGDKFYDFTALGGPRSRVFLHIFPLAAAAVVLIHGPRTDP